MKKFALVVIALALAIVMSVGAVSADRLPNSTPETQGLTVTQYVVTNGVFFENANYVNAVSSTSTPNAAPLGAGEVVSTVGYTQDIIALGNSNYASELQADTENKELNGNNLEVGTVMEFDGGRMLMTETLLENVVGMDKSATEAPMLCPFGAAKTTVYPPFCNSYLVKSQLDLTQGTIGTTAAARNIASTPDVPMSAGYAIGVTGSGSIAIDVGIHTLDARGTGTEKVLVPGGHKCCKPVYKTIVVPSASLDYTERTSVIGDFTVNKQINYVSGFSR